MTPTSALGRGRLRVLSFVAFAFFFSVVLTAQAREARRFYLAPNGSDENSGDRDAPLGSMKFFLEAAVPGDRLVVRGGVYRNQSASLTRSGAPGEPIVIENEPGEVPIFDGSDISRLHVNEAAITTEKYNAGDPEIGFYEIRGLVIRNYFRGGISVGWNEANIERTTHDILIEHNLVDACGQNGIMVAFCDRIVVRNNLVARTGWLPEADSWSSNINIYNPTGKEIRVTGNISFHSIDISKAATDGNGMILDMFQGPNTGGATVDNNFFFHNGGGGIVWTRTQDGRIVLNTLVDNGIDPRYGAGRCAMYLWREETQGDFHRMQVQRNHLVQERGLFVKVVDYAKLVDSDVSANVEATSPTAGDIIAGRPERMADSDRARKTLDALLSEVPDATRLEFERGLIAKSTAGQQIAWYDFVPSIDYVVSRGGLENCLRSVPADGAKRLGAFILAEKTGH